MMQIIFLLILILLSAFFSMSETALTAISRVKVRKLYETKSFGSRFLYQLRENPSKTLTTLLVSNNIANITAASITTLIFIDLLAKRGVVNEGITIGFSTFFITLAILVFGEIIPKTSAIKYADKLAPVIAPIIYFLSILITPIVNFLDWLVRPILKLLGAESKANIPILTEDDLKILLSVGEQEGLIEKTENKMIHSIFEFADTSAKEVMVPKPDMFCLNARSYVKDVYEKIVQDGHSRIPVYEGSPDNIVGIVLAKDLIKIHGKENILTLKDIMRPALFVPETKKIDELMKQMQSSRTHIAIVVDEYGVVSGLVTLEDLIEEIVGEIEDEFDKEEKDIEVLEDGSILVNAKLSIKDFNEKLGVVIPEGDYETVGGFVLSLIGRLPYVGDNVVYQDMKISVEKIQKRRITRIKINR